MPEIEVEEISQDRFTKFGDLLTIEDRPAKFAEEIFTFWDGLGYLKEKHDYEIGFLEVNDREKTFSTMERHRQTREVFFALDEAVLPVAPPEPDRSYPDPDKIEAFKIEPGSGVLFSRGCWHWLPFPLGDRARFLVIFKKATPDADLEKVDLLDKLDLEFRLDLS